MRLLVLAGNATLLYSMSEEAKEEKQAFLEKRKPDFKKFPRVPYVNAFPLPSTQLMVAK